MKAVNLGYGADMRNLAGLEGFLRNFSDAYNLRDVRDKVNSLDRKLFKAIINLYCAIGELDIEAVPDYSGFEDQVVFVDTLIWANFPEPQFRIEDLVKTLAKLRRKARNLNHQLACEPVLQHHYPELLGSLGLRQVVSQP